MSRYLIADAWPLVICLSIALLAMSYLAWCSWREAAALRIALLLARARAINAERARIEQRQQAAAKVEEVMRIIAELERRDVHRRGRYAVANHGLIICTLDDRVMARRLAQECGGVVVLPRDGCAGEADQRG